MQLPLGTFHLASAEQRCTFAEMISPTMHAKKTISKLHLESAAHWLHCIHRAVAWSHLRKKMYLSLLSGVYWKWQRWSFGFQAHFKKKKKHGRCNHYHWVLSFLLLSSILGAYSSGENEMTAIYGDFLHIPWQLSAHRAKEYMCTWEESWRESSWNELLYHWQIVGIKPEM